MTEKDGRFFAVCTTFYSEWTSSVTEKDFQNMHHEGNFVKFTADREGIWIFMKNYPELAVPDSGPFSAAVLGL